MEFEPRIGHISDLITIMVLIVIGALIGLLVGGVIVYKQIQAGALDNNLKPATSKLVPRY